MSKQNKIILIVVLIILATIVGFKLVSNKSKILQNKKIATNSEIQKQKNQIDKYKDEIKQVRSINEIDHLWGNKNAPIQMIVYSDFECSFCFNFYETLKQIKSEFGDKVVVAFRHFSLDSHLNALSASEASECADEQGKFWEMYDKLFANNKAGLMSFEQFKNNAKELNLDQIKFDKCLEIGQYKTKVLEQMSEGKSVGVIGTPTIFINNNIYPGAYPFEDFTDSNGKQERGMKNIIWELLK